MIVCNGNLALHDATHSGVGVHTGAILAELVDTRMLPRYFARNKWYGIIIFVRTKKKQLIAT